MFSRGTVQKIVSPGPATFTTNLKGKWSTMGQFVSKQCQIVPSGSCQGAVGGAKPGPFWSKSTPFWTKVAPLDVVARVTELEFPETAL